MTPLDEMNRRTVQAAVDAGIPAASIPQIIDVFRGYAERVRQATVDEIAAAGLLRTAPVATGLVKHVVRDADGRIVAVAEMRQQIEGGDPPEAA